MPAPRARRLAPPAGLALGLAALGAWSAAGSGPGAAAAGVSVRVVLAATLVVVAFGLPAALVLARWQSPLRPFLEALLLAPLVLPPTVTGFLLAWVLGRRGPLGALGVPLTFTWAGAALAAAVVSFPLFLRIARAAISGVDERYVGLARSLGAPPLSAQLRVVLPLALPGLLAGAVLAAGRALGEFGATLMVAGSIPGSTRTLPLEVYASFALGDDAGAAGLSLVLVAAALLALGGAAALEREAR